MPRYIVEPMTLGWFHITSTILVVSGGAKLANTSNTAGALRASGLPGAPLLVRFLAIVEIAAGAGSLAGFEAAVWVNGVLYFGFALFVLNAKIRRLPLQSCGCFGKSDTPATWGHMLVNLAAVGAVAANAIQPPSLFVTLGEQPALGLPYLGFVGLGSYLVILLLSELPATMKLARQ